MRYGGRVIGWAGVALLAGGCAEAAPGGDGTMAEVMCEQFVEERLRAPATAEFSDQTHVRADDGVGWIVTGSVDSENGFGALIRGSYQCELREDEDGDTWTASSVTVN